MCVEEKLKLAALLLLLLLLTSESNNCLRVAFTYTQSPYLFRPMSFILNFNMSARRDKLDDCRVFHS